MSDPPFQTDCAWCLRVLSLGVGMRPFLSCPTRSGRRWALTSMQPDSGARQVSSAFCPLSLPSWKSFPVRGVWGCGAGA